MSSVALNVTALRGSDPDIRAERTTEFEIITGGFVSFTVNVNVAVDVPPGPVAVIV
jgi:hypothetical protein